MPLKGVIDKDLTIHDIIETGFGKYNFQTFLNDYWYVTHKNRELMRYLQTVKE